MRKKRKDWNMKNPHLLMFFFFLCLTIKLGIFLRFLTESHPPSEVTAIDLYHMAHVSVFPNPFWGDPLFCSLDSCGSRDFHGFSWSLRIQRSKHSNWLLEFRRNLKRKSFFVSHQDDQCFLLKFSVSRTALKSVSNRFKNIRIFPCCRQPWMTTFNLSGT